MNLVKQKYCGATGALEVKVAIKTRENKNYWAPSFIRCVT
jgi:hypothetical protein